MVWKAYDKTSDTPSLRQKWYLDKVNYLCGDANMDGVLEVGEQFEFNGEIMNLPGADQSFIQNYINNPTILSNLQFFLSDVDKDGVISIMDATELQSYLAGSVDLSLAEQLYAADVNDDGEATLIDVTIIQEYCSGDINSLPVAK